MKSMFITLEGEAHVKKVFQTLYLYVRSFPELKIMQEMFDLIVNQLEDQNHADLVAAWKAEFEAAGNEPIEISLT